MAAVIGHVKQKDFLLRVLSGQVPHHMFIFHGPQGVGKRSLAESFARAAVTGSELSEYWNIPEHLSAIDDVVILAPQSISKKGVVSSTGITVRMVRDFRARLSLTKNAKATVIIIDQAQEMTIQAQNALLKIIEEPQDSTYIICITSQVEKLLPTICSRAMMMHFDTLENTDMEKIPGITQEILDFSFGRPVRAQSMIDDPNEYVRVKDAMQTLKDIRSQPVHDRMALAANLAKDGVLAIAILELWALRIYEVAHTHKRFEVLLLARRIEATLDDLRSTNTNKRLLLENLMISL